MGFIVKNTTKCGLFDLFCPHRCRGCGELGTVLCECCKNDIIADTLNHCPKCGRTISFACSECKMPFCSTFCFGYRDEIIGRILEEFKFYGVREMADAIADLLDRFLPDFEGEIVLVPLPTINKHVRERGVDHTLAVAKKLARKRNWDVEKLIGRRTNTVQLGADAKTRREQAKKAYEIRGDVSSRKTYLLFDDVWTTGASMIEAGKLLEKNGAKKIVAVVLATNRGRKPKIKR